MVKKICSLILCLFLFSCNKPAPKISNLQSELVPIEKQWLIVTYWAAWCGYCRAEIPNLNQLQQEFGSKVTVIALNYDHLSRKNNKLEQEVKQLSIEVNVLDQYGTKQFSNHFGLKKPKAIPTTIIIDKKGKVRKKLVGQQGASKIKQELSSLGFSN